VFEISARKVCVSDKKSVLENSFLAYSSFLFSMLEKKRQKREKMKNARNQLKRTSLK